MPRPGCTAAPTATSQDLSSQMVVDAMDVQAGDLVADVCAAPGGKATALAGRGARVVACDSHLGRIGRLMANRESLDVEAMQVLAADGRRPPLRPGCFDAVLVDAPCSGLGTLRRRPDARWRIELSAVPRLADLQRDLLEAAVSLLRPGGQLVYSVCTLTAAETLEVAAAASADEHLEVLPPPGGAVASPRRRCHAAPRCRPRRHRPVPMAPGMNGHRIGIRSVLRGMRALCCKFL